MSDQPKPTVSKESKPINASDASTSRTSREERDKAELMDVLHKYNDIKDATQKVLGVLATMEGTTAKEMHIRYNLPLDS